MIVTIAGKRESATPRANARYLVYAAPNAPTVLEISQTATNFYPSLGIWPSMTGAVEAAKREARRRVGSEAHVYVETIEHGWVYYCGFRGSQRTRAAAIVRPPDAP
jgi:hypothetical protein